MKQDVIEKCARAANAAFKQQWFTDRDWKDVSDASQESAVAWTKAAIAHFIRLGCPDLGIDP